MLCKLVENTKIAFFHIMPHVTTLSDIAEISFKDMQGDIRLHILSATEQNHLLLRVAAGKVGRSPYDW